MAKVQARLRVCGEVQGVGYRASARRVADSLGLTGWARNLADGSVEIVVEGERRDCEAMIDWCRKGPAYAEVSGVEVEWREATGQVDRFFIR